MKYLLIFCTLFFLIHSGYAQKNLVNNAGFEDELEAWVNYGAQSTPWVVKNGKTGAAIVTYDDSKWAGMHQVVYLPKNTEAVEVSVWMKADAIKLGNEVWKKGIVNMDFLVTDEIKVGDGVEIGTAVGTTDWRLYTKHALVPKDAKKCKIIVAMGFATGTLFVDEISCKAITKAEYNKHTVSTDEVEIIKQTNFLLQAINDKKILMVKDGSTEENAALIFSAISKEKEKQEWKVHNLLNGYYKIICINSAKAITQGGETFIQKNWQGDDEQQWKIKKTTKGFSLVNKVTKQSLKIENNDEWIIDGFVL